MKSDGNRHLLPLSVFAVLDKWHVHDGCDLVDEGSADTSLVHLLLLQHSQAIARCLLEPSETCDSS